MKITPYPKIIRELPERREGANPQITIDKNKQILDNRRRQGITRGPALAKASAQFDPSDHIKYQQEEKRIGQIPDVPFAALR